MNKPFGSQSLKFLAEAHPDLQKLFMYVNENVAQCTIVSGARTEEEQAKKVAQGLSKTMNSKHLLQPDGYCHALDVVPDPVNWDRKYFDLDCILFAGKVLEVARSMDIQITYGGLWSHPVFADNTTLHDYDHFELNVKS